MFWHEGKSYELITDWFDFKNTFFIVNEEYRSDSKSEARLFLLDSKLNEQSVVFHLGNVVDRTKTLQHLDFYHLKGNHIAMCLPPVRRDGMAFEEAGFDRVACGSVILNGRFLFSHKRDAKFDYGLFNIHLSGGVLNSSRNSLNLAKMRGGLISLERIIEEVEKCGYLRRLSTNAIYSENHNIRERFSYKKFAHPREFDGMSEKEFKRGVTFGFESTLDESVKRKGLWFVATGIEV
jgi:hypothetical protein